MRQVDRRRVGVVVDSELRPAKPQALDTSAMKDAFGRFVDRNQ